MGKGTVKVEDGKMVQVEVRGSKARLTGDFFIEPPEARERIEQKLEELEENVSTEKIVEKVGEVSAELIGFSAEGVAEAFKEARDS